MTDRELSAPSRRRVPGEAAKPVPPPDESPTRLLFLVHEIGHFLELFRVAAMLARSGRYHPVFMFDTAYDAMPEHLALCEENGMTSFVSWRPCRPVHMSKARRVLLAIAHPLRPLRLTFLKCRHWPERGWRRFAVGAPRWAKVSKPVLQIAAILLGVAAVACGAIAGRLLGEGSQQLLKRAYRRARNRGRLVVAPLASVALGLLRPILKPIRRIVREVSVASSTLRWYRNRIRQVRGLLESHGIDGVVTAEDNAGYATGVFTKLGRELGIPVVVIPYTIANASEFAESYFHTVEHQYATWPNRLVAAAFPQWHMTHRGRRLLRMPGWHVVAHHLFGMAPPAPWILNSGYADAIIVESERTVSYYRNAGLVTEKLVPAGALFDDVLAANLGDADENRERLYRLLALPAGRPMILVAVPPNQLPSRPDTDFESYESLIRAWLEPLGRATDFNVVVRLHPRIDRSRMAWIEEAGFRIAEADTASLVPLCDLYVASVSATIRWAIACGKPVINYDVFRYRYDDFADADGVVTIEEYAEYRRLVDRVTLDSAYLDEIRRRQRSCMETWGRLDGLSGARILAVFNRLTGRGNDNACEDSEGSTDEDGDRRNRKDGPAAHPGRQPVAA